MTQGIYILANDVVYDQLVALLNSIEANSSGFPIQIIPYDDRIVRVRAEIATRPNVEFFDDNEAIQRWEVFSTKVWKTHPIAKTAWQQDGNFKVNRMGMHRRFCVLDGPFEYGIYLDADILVLSSLEPIFEKLEQYAWVVYDFQHKDVTHVYNHHSPKLTQIFSNSRLETEIFCAGLYGCHNDLFSSDQQSQFLKYLDAGNSEILYMNGPDQSILNYMVMHFQIPVYNLALELPREQVTGNSVTSSHFTVQDNLAYDKGVQLLYLHYIGISNKFVTRLCQGENIDFPYRDLFLHYRYLHEPEKQPKLTSKPKAYNAPPTLMQRALKKLGI